MSRSGAPILIHRDGGKMGGYELRLLSIIFDIFNNAHSLRINLLNMQGTNYSSPDDFSFK